MHATARYSERSRNLGLTGGSLWLMTVGTAFAAWSLLAARSLAATWAFAAIAVIAITLTVFGLAMIRKLRRQPPGTALQQSNGRQVIRQFRMIVVVECGAFAVVNMACILTRHWLLIVPLDLIIVGLHFLPLARLFEVPRYSVMGTFFCVIPVVTMLAIPASAHVGSALGWVAIPSIGCALVALATAGAGLNEVRLSMPTPQTE